MTQTTHTGEEMEQALGSVGISAPQIPSPSLANEVCEPADVACMLAGKATGLVRIPGDNLLCPTSRTPSVGWYASATWDTREANTTKGGPWSVERVHRLCELGYFGIEPKRGNRATVTPSGRAALRAIKEMTRAADDGSQSPSTSDGEVEPKANTTEHNPPHPPGE